MSAWARELHVQLLSSTSIVQGQRQGGTGLSYWTLTAARLTVSLASKHHGSSVPHPLPFISCAPHTFTYPFIHPPLYPSCLALIHLRIHSLAQCLLSSQAFTPSIYSLIQ